MPRGDLVAAFSFWGFLSLFIKAPPKAGFCLNLDDRQLGFAPSVHRPLGVSYHWKPPKPFLGCGKRPLGPKIVTESQIIDGHDAPPGAWPWQVSLQLYEFPAGYSHVCGGSLINNNSILTAAHCIKSCMEPAFWRVVIGLHHLHKYSYHTVKCRVKAIWVHSNYSSDSNENDVALFKLVKSIKYSDYIQPICLPESPLWNKSQYSCYVSGWGDTKEKGKRKLILQEAQVDIIPLITCNQYDWYGGILTWNMLCAGSKSGRVDSCQGDSGGPLMCYSQNDTRFYLIGITSFGYGCGRPKYPGTRESILNTREIIIARIQGMLSALSSRDPAIWRVVIGLHHLNEDNSHTIKRRIKAIKIHPDYISETYENDIAVLILIRSIKFSDYARPICLPASTLLTNGQYPCYITGWGKTKEKGEGKLILQEAQVDIIPQKVCNQPDWYAGTVTLNMVCAGFPSGGVDSCQNNNTGVVCHCFPLRLILKVLFRWDGFPHTCRIPSNPHTD
ncbi:transmembrane protease serine 12-like isoform X2 [Python bivittatus]|uniref:Transmembrane protease serine 12-like isoform X2 n=1 Tax=Python bivittatus TaxID=176946 RepID=A0A9F5J6Q1_PYTBI|nr:transmembrane protease serine 12-like isoform X2 [Python bivittatus]